MQNKKSLIKIRKVKSQVAVTSRSHTHPTCEHRNNNKRNVNFRWCYPVAVLMRLSFFFSSQFHQCFHFVAVGIFVSFHLLGAFFFLHPLDIHFTYRKTHTHEKTDKYLFKYVERVQSLDCHCDLHRKWQQR